MDERTHGETLESLMEELEYRELRAMVEGHPSRLNLAEDEDLDCADETERGTFFLKSE